MAPNDRFADVEWLAKTEDVGVRVNTLRANAATPWHFHSVVTDNVFCLDEGLEIGLRGPDETIAMRPGQRQEIAPGRVHRLVNRSPGLLRYLLVQATGAYDFNEVP
jgi:quercetin dioxygenase-like cupin family protein